VEPLEDRTLPSTFTVTSASDSHVDGQLTLREAIQQANGNAGLDTIAFHIPGAGAHTIQLASALPFITDPVVLDGATQPRYRGKPLIDLDGTLAGNADGLVITAGGSTVRGLAVTNFNGNGIVLETNGNNLIQHDYIGADPTGKFARSNTGDGVLIFGGSSSNQLVQNVISANGRSSGLADGHPGVGIGDNGTVQNVLTGNFIGTDATGTKALGNGGVGVFLLNGTQGNRIGTDGDGVNDAAERNIIAANAYQGIAILGAGTDDNIVAGNYIGTDATGKRALGNGNNGVWMLQGAASNRVGTNGTDRDVKGERNVISGNTFSGVGLSDTGTTANLVAGNFIGTDVTGTKALGNGNNGVFLTNGAQANQIGGSAALANSIAFNQSSGLLVADAATTGNPVRFNSIFGNGDLGIDLGGDGVTLNDTGDGDTGPNGLQNYPIITSAKPGPHTTLTGTLNSLPGTSFLLDFYASAAPAVSFFGQGQRYLGAATVTTDASGNAKFTVHLPRATSFGQWVSVTATDPAGNTSEFSAAHQLPATPPSLSSTTWTPIGPAPIADSPEYNGQVVAGRVDAAAPDPRNRNVMYVSTDNGGIWKTTNWLSPSPTWVPLTDNQPSLAGDVHGLAVTAGGRILYATANGPGGGILKSNNAGKTWTLLANNLFDGASFGALVVSPRNADTLYVAVRGGPRGGVNLSTDGGQTWTDLTAGIHNGWVSDLVIDPRNPAVLYAGFINAADGSTNGIWTTGDGGMHWTPLSNGVPTGSAVGAYIALARAPSDHRTLYATVFDSSTGLPLRYRTNDGGNHWSPLTSPGLEEGRYWHTLLAVDPADARVVYVNGEGPLYRSKDGGTSWSQVYAEDPVGGSFDDTGAFVLVGDRGIYRWTGPGSLFTNKQGNLQVTELYNVTLDPTDPSVAYGISQDHFRGLKFTGGPVWNYLGGAGETGKVLVDPTNSARLYEYDPLNGTSFVYRSDDGGASWVAKGDGIPTTPAGFGLAYTAQNAFAMDPGNPARLLVGTTQVYETTSSGELWTAISPQLSSGQFITNLAIAPSDGSTVYVATDDGRLYMTPNDGTNWFERDGNLPAVSYNRVADIAVDPSDSQHVFIVTNGTGASNHIWLTTGGGAAWGNITGNLPVNYWVNTIAVDWRHAMPVLFVGTARGVFRSTDLGVTWSLAAAGMPNTTVTDLEFLPQFSLLAAATYGRGVFEIREPGGHTKLAPAAPATARPLGRAPDGLPLLLDSLKSAPPGEPDLARLDVESHPQSRPPNILFPTSLPDTPGGHQDSASSLARRGRSRLEARQLEGKDVEMEEGLLSFPG
jgi:hypothetical protein